MITEDYVSFEVAKFLKEKGFNWEWSPFYSEQDRDGWAQDNNYNIPNPDYDANIPFDSETINVIAPHVSLQMAMKWLREVHNIFIDINVVYVEGSDKLTYLWLPCVIKQGHIDYPTMEEYMANSYEEACEAAIKYCLTNLI